MQPDKNQVPDQKESETANPVSNENQQGAEENAAAFETAAEDIEQDPDLSIHSPNDDLDEGETARLGEDKTDLV